MCWCGNRNSSNDIQIITPNPRSLQGDDPELTEQLAAQLNIRDVSALRAVLRRRGYILTFDYLMKVSVARRREQWERWGAHVDLVYL